MIEKSSYTDYQKELSAMLRVLAHPARIAMMQELCSGDTCNSKIVNGGVKHSITAVSHLRSLEKAGFIKGNFTNSSKISYCVNWEKFNQFKNLLDELNDSIQSYGNSICEKNINC